MKVEVQTQILSTETLSKVHILSILELIELFRTTGKIHYFHVLLIIQSEDLKVNTLTVETFKSI